MRPAVRADLDAIVDVHLAAFHSGFTLSALGPAFICPYYDLILKFKQHIFFVAQWENEVVGFAAGFKSPRLFYQSLKAAKWRFIFTLLWVVLKNPFIVLRILGGFKRIKRKTNTSAIPDQATSHLCSLAVKPTFANRGIGKTLVRTFNSEARNRGASLVVITTDAENNDAVNEFYKRLGFQCIDTYYRSVGRLINEYVLPLDIEEDSSRISKAA
jgi:ribosomal protein S18 acetylase RimI-like enzyme